MIDNEYYVTKGEWEMYENCNNNCPAYHEDCEGQGCLFRNSDKQVNCKLPKLVVLIIASLKNFKEKVSMFLAKREIGRKNKLPF
jgi:hypothetical protein